MQNYRYDEFLGVESPQFLSGEPVVVPASSPYYVPLREVPRQTTPSSITVYSVGASSTAAPTKDCSFVGSINSDGDTLRIAGSTSLSSRGLMQFDISSLPSNPALVKLRLQVGLNDPTPPAPYSVTIGIHQVNASWNESTTNATNQPAFNAVASSQFQVASRPVGDTSYKWEEADITALYNAWKSGTNNGLLLKHELDGIGSVRNVADIYSRTFASTTLRPQLIVIATGQSYEEVAQSITPGAGQFAVAYQTGRMRFHSSAAGQTLLVDYQGLGSPIDAKHKSYWAGYGITAGSSTVYTVTVQDVDALRAGLFFFVQFHIACGSNPTLNVNGLGAVALHRLNSPLTTAQVGTGLSYLVFYTGSVFQVIGV